MNLLITTDEADCALMERVQRDDHAALSMIVGRHWGPLVNYSTRIVGTVDAAEEVVQETFVRLWERRKRWNPGGSVKAFLFRTSRNLGLGWLRHMEVRRRTEPEIRRSMEESTLTPLDEVTEQELRRAVWKALDVLPPRRREALVLVRLRGKSLDQAAEEMGLSRQTVANHISLALNDLEPILKEYTG